MIDQQELDKHKCLHRIKLEKLMSEGLIDSRPFRDVDCRTCQNYYSGIVCMHYTSWNHITYFNHLFKT